MDNSSANAAMKHLVVFVCLTCLCLAGCATNGDSRGPDSREAWLRATGGQFDGSLPD